jgi:hypothetical protein
MRWQLGLITQPGQMAAELERVLQAADSVCAENCRLGQGSGLLSVLMREVVEGAQ